MNLLLKQVKIVAPESKLNGKTRDIHIKDGVIAAIDEDIHSTEAQQIDIPGACVSIGWVDVGAEVGEPGFEYREDIKSISEAAAGGGFTAIACQPNTDPAIHSKSEVYFLKQQSQGNLVSIYPIGAVSRNCEGQKITEMLDMKTAGAIAFSDGRKPIQNNGMMKRALQYVTSFDGLVINQPLDKSLATEGQMHEGKMSTALGMPGIPSLAEELMVQRDIYLAEYTDSRLHLANISSARAVELVKEAKSKGLKVSASVAPVNLAFSDQAVEAFESNFKVMPPLREEGDIEALKIGLKKGVIDMITSNHIPRDEEAKNLEYPYADFGVSSLETSFATANTYLQDVLNLEEIIDKFAYAPRRILKLPAAEIKVEAKADLTVFSPSKKWTVSEKSLRSKCKNTPFLGMGLVGKVEGVINNGQAIFPGRL